MSFFFFSLRFTKGGNNRQKPAQALSRSASNQEKGNGSAHVNWSKFTRELVHGDQKRMVRQPGEQQQPSLPSPDCTDKGQWWEHQRWEQPKAPGELEPWRGLRPWWERLLFLLALQFMSPIGETQMPADRGHKKQPAGDTGMSQHSRRRAKDGCEPNAPGAGWAFYEQVMLGSSCCHF